MSQQYLPYLVPLIIAALVLRRAGRAQKISMNRLWIRPAIITLLAGFALVAEPFPGLIAIAAFAAAAVAGIGFGYLRARHQNLSIDPETGQVSSTATMIGTLLFLAVFAVRYGVKIAFPQMANPGHGGTQVILITNGLLIFTAAMFVTQALLIRGRTQPLLDAHAARTLSPPTE
jgi:hypothetical protein